MTYEGGQVLKSFALPPTYLQQASLCWMPDGRTITYADTRNGVSNIWGQPLDGGVPKQLTNFRSEQIRAFAWSRDGQLAVSRGLVSSNAVLISGEK